MAQREVYIGSMGPFLYNDAEPMPGQENEVDPILQRAINADGVGAYGFLFLESKTEAEIEAPPTNQVAVFINSDDGSLTLYDGTNFFKLDYQIRTRPVTNLESPYTPTIDDDVILVDASASDIVVNLPTAVGNNGLEFVIKRTDTSTNLVTVDGDGTELIDTEETINLLPGDSMNIVSDNVQWWII